MLVYLVKRQRLSCVTEFSLNLITLFFFILYTFHSIKADDTDFPLEIVLLNEFKGQK